MVRQGSSRHLSFSLTLDLLLSWYWHRRWSRKCATWPRVIKIKVPDPHSPDYLVGGKASHMLHPNVPTYTTPLKYVLKSTHFWVCSGRVGKLWDILSRPTTASLTESSVASVTRSLCHCKLACQSSCLKTYCIITTVRIVLKYFVHSLKFYTYVDTKCDFCGMKWKWRKSIYTFF